MKFILQRLITFLCHKNIAYCNCFRTYEKDENIFYDKSSKKIKINDFDMCLFRPDPPVDMDYINSTYIFDYVDESKTVLLNNPRAIRNFNEKLHATLFLDLMPENIVTSSRKDILDFLDENEKIIIKPLNQCFGGGVMYLQKGDKNTSVIINNMTKNSSTLVMVQKYIEKAKFGDIRVMTLGDEVFDYCVQKLPSNNDFKFNEHCDANIIKAELTEDEKAKFSKVAIKLNSMGLPLVGLDVIDGKIIEINVTSPCYFIHEVNRNFNIHSEDKLTDYILSRAKVTLSV
jgi:glutathione synthase